MILNNIGISAIVRWLYLAEFGIRVPVEQRKAGNPVNKDKLAIKQRQIDKPKKRRGDNKASRHTIAHRRID